MPPSKSDRFRQLYWLICRSSRSVRFTATRIAQRLQQMSKDVLQVQQGILARSRAAPSRTRLRLVIGRSWKASETDATPSSEPDLRRPAPAGEASQVLQAGGDRAWRFARRKKQEGSPWTLRVPAERVRNDFETRRHWSSSSLSVAHCSVPHAVEARRSDRRGIHAVAGHRQERADGAPGARARSLSCRRTCAGWPRPRWRARADDRELGTTGRARHDSARALQPPASARSRGIPSSSRAPRRRWPNLRESSCRPIRSSSGWWSPPAI